MDSSKIPAAAAVFLTEAKTPVCRNFGARLELIRSPVRRASARLCFPFNYETRRNGFA